MGNKIGKLIFRLLIFGSFVCWFVFSIWGISKWGDATSFVSEKTTILLLTIPTIIGMFIIFFIVSIIGGVTKKKKVKKGLSFSKDKDGERVEINIEGDQKEIPNEMKEFFSKFTKGDDNKDMPKEIKEFFSKFSKFVKENK
ncbi:hypothetical protein ES705_48981 [subsurface metagenome]